MSSNNGRIAHENMNSISRLNDSWPGYLPPGGTHQGTFSTVVEVNTKKKFKFFFYDHPNLLSYNNSIPESS